MMKIYFYFILKALFIFKIFKFLSWLFWPITGHGLLGKLRLISKLMTSQSGKQTTTIDILPNISRRKRKSDNEICSVNSI